MENTVIIEIKIAVLKTFISHPIQLSDTPDYTPNHKAVARRLIYQVPLKNRDTNLGLSSVGKEHRTGDEENCPRV